jgi:hypothetical protein
VYLILPVSLDCPFVIAPSVSSNVYFKPLYVHFRSNYQAICQQHHDEKKLLFVSNIMARASYYLSATSWREQVTICQQHHGENKLLFVSNIMALFSP